MSDKNILFERYADMGDEIIFPAFDHNCLYSMEKKNKKIKLLGLIPGENLCGFRSFFSVASYKKKIVLVPFDSKNIVVYDNECSSFEVIELKNAFLFDNVDVFTNDGKFACCSVWKNKLFMFPHFYPALVILNLDTNELVYNTEFIEKIASEKCNGEPYVTDIDVIKETVYGSLGCCNGIIRYDMADEKLDFKQIFYNGTGFNGIKVDDDNIVLGPRLCGPIVVYNKNLNTIKEYENFPIEFKSEIIPFHSVYKINDGYLFVPDWTSEALFLDYNKNEFVNLTKVSTVLRGERKFIYSRDRLLAYGMDCNIFWFVNRLDQLFYEYDIYSGDIVSRKLVCEDCPVKPQDIAENILNNQTDNIYEENDICGINEFVMWISRL